MLVIVNDLPETENVIDEVSPLLDELLLRPYVYWEENPEINNTKLFGTTLPLNVVILNPEVPIIISCGTIEKLNVLERLLDPV